jgi:hypothetical protein
MTKHGAAFNRIGPFNGFQDTRLDKTENSVKYIETDLINETLNQWKRK